MNSAIWLVGLLIVPGLFALALLMSWMESRLTQQMVEHDVTTAWRSAVTPEEIEDIVRRSAAKLLVRAQPPRPAPTHAPGGKA